MPGLIDTLETASRPLLWLDDTAYVERLLAGGQTPWLDCAQYLALRRKAQGLLQADLTALPLMGFLRAWADAQVDLRTAMTAKKRAVFPARALLADEALAAYLVEVVHGMRAMFAGAPLVLALPSPRALVPAAWRLAYGADAEVEVGADEADACAVYVAEFLRHFGGCGVDALLLEECAGAEPANAEELGWYQPVTNLAAHYRWALGLRLPDAAGFSGDAAPLQFVIAPRAIAGVVHGQVLAPAFWDGATPDPAPASRFCYLTVPGEAVPEQVLARLAVLRQE